MRPLRLGFVGGGLNSAIGLTHKIASQMDGLWSLESGVFSRTQPVNQATGEAWGLASSRVHRSFEEFVDNEAGRLDAVAVLTPTPDHARRVADLLGAGFNVISEKALASTVAGATDICRAEELSGRFLTVTHNYSGYPLVRELRELIRAGGIGNPLSIQVEMPQEGFIRLNDRSEPNRPQVWREVDGEIPTVCLDLGVHVHHLVQFLIGVEPAKVVATFAHHGRISTIVDEVQCLALYPGDVRVTATFGKTCLGNRNGLRIRVFGDAGSAEWTQISPERMLLSDSYGQLREVDRGSPGLLIANEKRFERFKAGHPAGFIEAFANLYCDIAVALRHRIEGESEISPWITTSEQARLGLVMMDAITQSVRDEAWVDV